MRLWSIHPSYLDQKGLNAVWREALLAKAVLQEKTKGYKNHPQLTRFKETDNPVLFINSYLKEIHNESCKRNYCFDLRKVGKTTDLKMKVNEKQLEYEFKHLMKKLKERNPEKLKELKKVKNIKPHSLFKVVKGGIEQWEILS